MFSRISRFLASRNQIRQDVISGTQRHQDGRSSRPRTAGVRLRIAASGARVRGAGGLVMRRLARRTAVLAGLPVLIAGLAAGTAAAASGGGQVSNYTGTGISAPFGITAGPDGALWFTNQNGEPDSTGGTIGKIATSGNVTNYGNSLIDDPAGITAGNGALWFTNFANGAGGSIGEMTPSGVLTNDYTGDGIDGPEGITAGPDGGLWFTNVGNSSIGEITITPGTTGTVTVHNYPNPSTGCTATPCIDDPTSITAGPDGEQALWFTNNQNDSIGKITTPGTTGTVTISNYTYDNGADTNYGLGGPTGITAGPDDALWFTNMDGGPDGKGTIGRITPSGALSTPGASASIVNPAGITAGPDGALWFTNNGGTDTGTGTGTTIGRITTSGTIYSYSGTGISGPEGITAGPDGALWFTNYGANGTGNSIGRITPPASQTIIFTSTPPSSPPFGSPYPVSATATSGLPVTVTIDAASTSVCSVSGSTVTFNHAGSCVIDASQAGNAAWLPAQAQQVITVPKETPALAWATPANITYPAPLASTQLDATASVPGTFTYNPGIGTVLPAGTHALTATFTPADTTDYTSGGTVSTQITVLPATPALAWARPASITYGTALTGTQLDATTSVRGTFTYNPAAGTVLAIGTHTLTATFTPADTTDYTSGGTVSTQITVVLPPHCTLPPWKCPPP
jgi:streptogramin lyase